MEEEMKVTFELPDPIGWALTDHAEKRGTERGAS